MLIQIQIQISIHSQILIRNTNSSSNLNANSNTNSNIKSNTNSNKIQIQIQVQVKIQIQIQIQIVQIQTQVRTQTQHIDYCAQAYSHTGSPTGGWLFTHCTGGWSAVTGGAPSSLPQPPSTSPYLSQAVLRSGCPNTITNTTTNPPLFSHQSPLLDLKQFPFLR